MNTKQIASKRTISFYHLGKEIIRPAKGDSGSLTEGPGLDNSFHRSIVESNLSLEIIVNVKGIAAGATEWQWVGRNYREGL